MFCSGVITPIRIAFSFPISDEAQFFAHYDVLTQRPPERSSFSPTEYYFLEQNIGGLLNTSLNLHGYPVVCTPDDAIQTFDSSKLDMLLIGNIIIKRDNYQ